MIKKFLASLGFVLAVNGFAFAQGDGDSLVSAPYDVEVEEASLSTIVITERGIVSEFFEEISSVSSVFEDKGLCEGIAVVGDIIRNPNRRFFDKYPRLRAFINTFKSCLGC